MAHSKVNVGGVDLSNVAHGDNVVVAIHGNLGCADWLGLVLSRLPRTVRVIHKSTRETLGQFSRAP